MPNYFSDLIESIFSSIDRAGEGVVRWGREETGEEKRRRLLEELGVTAFEDQGPPLMASHGDYGQAPPLMSSHTSNYTVPFERPSAPQGVRAVDRGGQLLMTNLPEYGEMPDYDLEQFRSRMTQPASSYLSDQDFEMQGGMPSFDSMQLQALGGMDPRTQGADLSRLLTQRDQAQLDNDYRFGSLGVRQQNANTTAAVAPSRVDANTATADSARALAAKRLVETSFQREELQRLVSGAATPGEIAKLASVIQRIEATGLGGEFGDKLKELYAHYTSRQAVGQNVNAMTEGVNANTPSVAPIGAELPRGLASAPPPTHPITDRSGQTHYAYVESEPGFGIQGGRGVTKGGVRYWVVN